jgi:hypothetical protein
VPFLWGNLGTDELRILLLCAIFMCEVPIFTINSAPRRNLVQSQNLPVRSMTSIVEIVGTSQS